MMIFGKIDAHGYRPVIYSKDAIHMFLVIIALVLSVWMYILTVAVRVERDRITNLYERLEVE